MSSRETLTLYLDAPALRRVEAGTHNFFGKVIAAVTGAGWQVALEESTLASRLAAPARPGHALFHMEEPTHERALTCRRSYVGAFWQIEAVAERWHWPVARAAFAPETVDARQAETFFRNWKNRLWPGGCDTADRGHIFVPLQGRLLDHRRFQAMSPLAMLETLLAWTDRPVIATLHPNEIYPDDEIAALAALAARQPRLTVQKGGSAEVLAGAAMVACENSTMAFEGYFLEKPALLFAQIDFHHIAASVPRDGIEAALAPRPAPDVRRYLYWFLQQRAINAGRGDSGDRILAALRRNGWPI